MLIGEVVAKSGLSKDTIRFYEKKGLIHVDRTESEWNNYKNYTDDSLKRLELIKMIKGFGFTLNETSEMLEMIEMGTASCLVVSNKVSEKIESIDRKIKELETVKQMIFNKIKDGQTNCNPKTNSDNCQVFLKQ